MCNPSDDCRSCVDFSECSTDARNEWYDEELAEQEYILDDDYEF